MESTQSYLVLFTVLLIFLSSNGQYYPAPRSSNDLRAILRQSLELKCEYKGVDDNPKFLGWYKNGNQSVKDEKPGHYVVKDTYKESRLIIKIFVQADGDVDTWSVKINKPGYETRQECTFGRIPLISSPQGIKGNRKGEDLESSYRSIRRTEDDSVVLQCLIKPDQPDQPNSYRNSIQWQFSKDDKTYTELPDGVIIQYESQISIERISKAHRGYYRCKLNDVEFTVLLRVKDRLAALWPFLGIVGTVAVLVIVILIFEKRQKSAKKATADDDDHAHANDPLVRSSDNESKKRAIKT